MATDAWLALAFKVVGWSDLGSTAQGRANASNHVVRAGDGIVGRVRSLFRNKARCDSVSALDETGLTRHKRQLLLDRLCSFRVADAVRRNDLGPFFVAIQDFNGLRG